MRLSGAVTFGLMLALAGNLLAAQEKQGSGSKDQEPDFTYRPPAAWKSVEIGDFYFKRKDYSGALSRYQEAIRTDPDYPRAYLGLGRVYEKLGRPRQALEAYRHYLDALPSAKQAQEAREVHQAIARLERELNAAKKAKPRP